ncbi:unnamed protein product, partial [Arabidopsis halleri]
IQESQATLQAQATEIKQSKEKMHSYDAYFEYLAEILHLLLCFEPSTNPAATKQIQ